MDSFDNIHFYKKGTEFIHHLERVQNNTVMALTGIDHG